MEAYNTYIQQLSYDGVNYSQGSVVDLLETFHVVCEEIPFLRNPKPKDIPTRDWAGEDGLDIYIPDTLPIKDYQIEVAFLYKGTETEIRTDISRFIDFLYGRRKGHDGDTVQSARLAIYNEYVGIRYAPGEPVYGIGRKDVVVVEIGNELFDARDTDPDAIARFKVKFNVYDPTTEVRAVYNNINKVTSFVF